MANHLNEQSRIFEGLSVLEPLNFANLCLKHLMPYPVPEFHLEIYGLLHEKRLAIAAPRSFAKSTIVSFIYPLWLVCFSDQREDIVIVSSTASLAEEWLRKVKLELETNPNIRALVGDQISDKWATDHIVLKNGNQIRAKGRGYQIRGFRPTKVIVDDIEDDEGVRSPEQREHLKDWFFKALLNTLERDSQLIVIGTLLHPSSLLSELLVNSAWVTRKYKALPEEGISLWEEKWPTEALLERKKEIGTIRFEAEYQNNPLAAVQGTFRPEWIRWFEDKELADLYVITTVDPAVSTRESADYTAINTVGVYLGEGKKVRYNLDCERGRWSIVETVDKIISKWKRFGSQMIWIEEFGFQQALRQYLDRECERLSIALPIHRMQLGRGWFKKAKDKVTRAMSVSYLFEQGLVQLRQGQNVLYDELLTFPYGDHEDTVDALVYGLLISMELEREGALVGNETMDNLGAVMGAEKSFEIVNEQMPATVWQFEKQKKEWQYF